MVKRPGLNKAFITKAAGELADAIGFHGLTLLRVAEYLGVRTPSLYNHIDGLDGLRHELSLLGMSELNKRLQRSALGKSKDEALTSMLQAYRAFAMERPGLYTATLQAPEIDDLESQSVSQEIIDTVLAVLDPYNLEPDEAVHVIRAFRTIGHGFASLEAAGAFGIDLDTDESYQRLVTAFLRGLISRTDGS